MAYQISDASEIHFWPIGEDSFNLEQEGYTDDYCFHQKFLCSGLRRLQVVGGADDDGELRLSILEDGVEVETIDFTQTSNEIAGTPEIPGVPLVITLPALSLGVNISIGGTDWVTGSNPSVSITGAGTVFSDLLSNDYAFVAGETYNISFEINCSFAGGASVNTIYFAIYDIAFASLFSEAFSAVGSTVSGTFSFVATSASVKYGFRIDKTGAAVATFNADIASISATQSTPATPAVPAVPATYYLNEVSFSPYDYSLCDKKLSFKIVNGSSASIVNGDFNSTLSPSFSGAPGTNAWSWFAGAARVTLPSALDQTEVLNIPFSAILGNTYDFELNLDVLVGAGSSGATTRIGILFTDGVSLTDSYASGFLDVGNHVLNISKIATSNWTSIQIVVVVVGSSSYGRIVDINSIQNSTLLSEYFYSDEVEFVSSWPNSNNSGRVVIQYRSIQNFAELIYNDASPYFSIDLDGRFRKERKISVQKTLELTEMVLNTAASVKKQKKLTLNDMPDYMHTKVQLILAHAASGSVIVNGLEISLEEGYEEGSRPESYPLSPAEVFLTDKNYYKHNVI